MNQYEATKKDVSEWQPVVKQMREAPHLNFPLNPSPSHSVTSNFLTKTFTPETDMEIEVQKLLEESNIDESKIIENEDMMERQLSFDEIKKKP